MDEHSENSKKQIKNITQYQIEVITKLPNGTRGVQNGGERKTNQQAQRQNNEPLPDKAEKQQQQK